MVVGLMALALAAPLDELEAWAPRMPAPDPVPDLAASYRFAGPALLELAALARERPGLLEVERLGTSEGGRPIWAFHVADPAVTVDEEVLVVAGIHALEWIGSEVALDLLHEVLDHPTPGVRVTVVPWLNPDGRAHVESDLLHDRIDRYRRGNGAGVDLNRDFTAKREVRAIWARLIPGYYAHSEAPLSQPESRALEGLLARHHYARAASLHSFGGYLYHPWAGSWARPEAWAEHVVAGRRMEKAQGAGAYRTRQLARWGFFFRAHGTELDHLYARHGAQAWLVELTRSGLRPLHLQADRRTPFRWYNPVTPEPHRRRGLAAMRVLVRGDRGDPAATDAPVLPR